MQELPAGWIQTAPPGTTPWNVTISRNQVSTGHDFGTFPLPGSIDGTVRPRPGSGLPDDIIEGIRVYLDADGDHRFDTTEPNTLTDRFGDFQFPDLYPGRYDVTLVLPGGASQVVPNYFTQRGHVVNLAPAEQRHVEFELADAGSISGTKYLDKNSNGTIEFGEPQIGQLIFIDYNRDGMLDDTEPRTITDSMGQYRFDNLPPGSYWLRDFAGQVISAPDSANNRSFGHAGVFAGDSLIISDPDAMAMNPATGQLEPIGRVYVVDMTSGNVMELAGPTPTGGSDLRENFGWSIAVNDTTIAVGSPVTDFDDTMVASPGNDGHVYLFDRATGLIQGRIDSPRADHVYGVSLASLGANGFAIGAPAELMNTSAPPGFVDLVDSDGSLRARIDPPEASEGSRFGMSLAATVDSLVIRMDTYSQRVGDYFIRYLAADFSGQIQRNPPGYQGPSGWLPSVSPQRLDYVSLSEFAYDFGLSFSDYGSLSCSGSLGSGEFLSNDPRSHSQSGASSIVGLQVEPAFAAVGYVADNRVLTLAYDCLQQDPLRQGVAFHERIELPAQYAQVDSQFGYSLATDSSGTRLLIGDPGGNQSPGQAFLVSIGKQAIVRANDSTPRDFRSLYPDTDSDGVGDPVEMGAPGQGDGNADGIPDYLQPNVASLRNTIDGNYVTLVAADDDYLRNVAAFDNVPSYYPSAPQQDFPLGFFNMVVEKNWRYGLFDSVAPTNIELWDHSTNGHNVSATTPLGFNRVEHFPQGQRWARSLQDQPGNPLNIRVAYDGSYPPASVYLFGGPSRSPVEVIRITELSSPPPPPLIENNSWALIFEAGLSHGDEVTIGADWDNDGTIDQTAIHRGQSVGSTPSARFSGPYLPPGNNTIRFVIDPDGIAQEYFHTVYVEGEFDNDDVLDAIEDAAPNNGDGNNDGVPDSQQPNVVSLPNAVDGSYITLVAPTGTMFRSVTTFTPESRGLPAPPPNLQFPVGLVDFRLDAVPADTEVAVQMIVHGAVVPQSYYKLNYQGWVDFGYEGRTGATFAGNVITLHFVDNHRGDDDSQLFRIHDPGGPAVLPRPTLLVEGPETGVRGQPLEFTFTTDMAGTYTYDIDWDGDGNVDESTSGNETRVVKHVYVSEGDFSVIVTATSADDVPSDPVTHDVSIDVMALIDGNLVVGGTTGHDHIRFYRSGHNHVSVRLNRDRLGPFALSADAQLVAYGQDGNDRIYVSGNLPYDASFFGGAGRDLLVGGRGDDLLDGGDGDDWLFGGLGNNVLVGNEGNDRLFGGVARDVLIGGAGADRLYGGFGEDLLIGGSTVYDNDRDSLREILARWTLPIAHAQRVELLLDESQAVYLKSGETVLDDDSVDRLFGGLGEDWFFWRSGQDRLIGHQHRCGHSLN